MSYKVRFSVSQSLDFGIEEQATNYVIGSEKVIINNYSLCSFAQYHLQRHARQDVCCLQVFFHSFSLYF